MHITGVNEQIRFSGLTKYQGLSTIKVKSVVKTGMRSPQLAELSRVARLRLSKKANTKIGFADEP
jgi:hypothetical protein